MTLRGIFVLILEVLLVILALGTEFKEFLVVALCIGGLMIYSLVSLFLASLTVSVACNVNKKTVLRGEKVKYKLTIFGTALLPIASYLSIKTAANEFDLKGKSRHSFILLPTFSIEHNFTFEILCAHVGNWEIGIKNMRFEDIFGLFSFRVFKPYKSSFITTLSVMPKIYDLDGEESVVAGGYGSTSATNAEEGELLGDNRLYREGDSLKRINWKLSARTKTLYSRQYEMPQKPRVMIVVDKGVFGAEISDMADISCETAISIAKYFVENNNAVEIITVRDAQKEENEHYSLKSYNDIIKMQEVFSDISFYNNGTELHFLTEDAEFLKAEKIYFITTNPSSALLKEFEVLNNNDKFIKCIVPRAVSLSDYFEQNNYLSDNVRLDITSTDQIEQRVGEVL